MRASESDKSSARYKDSIGVAPRLLLLLWLLSSPPESLLARGLGDFSLESRAGGGSEPSLDELRELRSRELRSSESLFDSVGAKGAGFLDAVGVALAVAPPPL